MCGRADMDVTQPAVSMIGPGSAPAMLAARALLAGNDVPHRWIDTDADPLGRILAERAEFGAARPVALFADGSRLEAPADFVEPAPGRARRLATGADAVTRQPGMAVPARTPPELVEQYTASAHWRTEPARRCGLRTRPEHELYDVVVVGAGDDDGWWTLSRPPLPLESSQPGLFVAGDVRHGSIKRVASAATGPSAATRRALPRWGR